jgi:uncharacterized paraquat-inducible protein A
MDKYIQLVASIQENIKVVAAELKAEGQEDLSILLSLCAAQLADSGPKAHIKAAITTIYAEAEERKRMKMCPKCQAVMDPTKPCAKCGATLERTAP